MRTVRGHREATRACVSLSLLVSVSCHDVLGVRRSDAGRDAPSAPALEDSRADAGPVSRCTFTTGGGADARFGEGEELGEAVAFSGGFAFGALRGSDGGRTASVVGVATPGLTRTDLGASWGDAPPPQPVVRADALYAVAYVKRPRAVTGRSLSLHRVGGTESPIDLPPESDVSAAYDVVAGHSASPVGALVVWDDVTGGHAATLPRGVVELAVISADMRAVRSVRAVAATLDDASLASDASDPRLAVRPGGYWLTWLARRPERLALPLARTAGEIETPSEEATYSWVEAVALDLDGAFVGTSKRLTVGTGHVGSYAIASHDDALVVIAEDDGAAAIRGGGSLEQVRWRGLGAPETAVVVRGGVDEDTAPAIVSVADDLWLTFLDVRGEADVLPLSMGQGAASRAIPSVEPRIGGGRLLGGTTSRLGLATLDGAAWTLRWVACVR